MMSRNTEGTRANKSGDRRIIVELLSALKDARDHLEYCGYGDKWERECAKAQKLEQFISSAIQAGEDFLWDTCPQSAENFSRFQFNQNKMNFHEWLISQRKYCERCNWGKGENREATRVIKDEHGQEIVVCEEHANKYEHNTSIRN